MTNTVGAPNSIMRKFHELPEPETPMTHYNVRTSTPWGTSQSSAHYGNGITLYSTAGHGGFHVSKRLLSRIPDYLQIADAYADGMIAAAPELVEALRHIDSRLEVPEDGEGLAYLPFSTETVAIIRAALQKAGAL